MSYTQCYIQTRNQHSYYFRFRTPKHIKHIINKSEIFASLKTDSISTARYKVALKLPIINQLKHICASNVELIKFLYSELISFTYDGLNPAVSVPVARSVVRSIPIQAKPALLLNDAWKVWGDFKAWSEKSTRNYEIHRQFLIAVWGNKDVTEITKADIKQALINYSKLPLGNQAIFNRMNMSERVQASKNLSPQVKTQSSKSVKELLKTLQGFFSAYLTTEVDVLSMSPTANVKWVADEIRGGAFTVTEMKKIVGVVDKEQGSTIKWALLLSVFSGMRRSEVVRCLKEGVKFDPDSGIYFYNIKAGKTKNAIRQVPVADALVERGITEIGKIDLTEKALSDYMAKVVKECAIPSLSSSGEKRTLHSLRHSFISIARKDPRINLSLLQEVVGHSKNGGLTDRYTHKFDLVDTKPVVDAIKL